MGYDLMQMIFGIAVFVTEEIIPVVYVCFHFSWNSFI